MLLTLLLLPHLQFLGELWYNEEGLPALALFGLEDVAEDVVSNVEDVLPFHVQQVAHNVRRAWNHSHQGEFHQQQKNKTTLKQMGNILYSSSKCIAKLPLAFLVA